MGEIEDAILVALYEEWSRSDEPVHLEKLRLERGWDKKSFDKAERRLLDDGYVEPRGVATLDILPHGVMHVEKNKLADDDLTSRNVDLRLAMLEYLGREYDESGPDESVYYDHLAQHLGFDSELVLRNIDVLKGFGLVKPESLGFYATTQAGLQVCKELKQRDDIADEFESIKRMTPQPRGRAIQKLIAKIIGQQRWKQEEGVRTSHEEMDVIVSQGREYFLIESKWERAAIEAPVVRELYGKVANRIGVNGILMSMSGFTAGAVTQTEQYVNSKIILLFGQEDIKSIVSGDANFEQLLNEKHRQLITQRKVVFE